MQTHTNLNGRQLTAARRSFTLSHTNFAAVLGVSTLSLVLRELGVMPVGQAISQLCDAFAQGFRPANWPAHA